MTKTFAEAVSVVTGHNAYAFETELEKKRGFSFVTKALGLVISNKSFPVSNMPNTVPGEIYLCTPIWGGKMAAPAKFFLENADLQRTTVHLVLTASTPVEKYRTRALNFLEKIQCNPGNAHIFATSSKIPPEKDVLIEQLKDLLHI